MRFSRNSLLIVLMAVSLPSLFSQSLPERQRFETVQAAMTTAFRQKDVDTFLSGVWWVGSDRGSRDRLTKAFQEICRFPIVGVQVKLPTAIDRALEREGGGKTNLRTALPIDAILEVEVQFGADSGDTMLFQYPLGRAEGRLWILPWIEGRAR